MLCTTKYNYHILATKSEALYIIILTLIHTACPNCNSSSSALTTMNYYQSFGEVKVIQVNN